MRSQRNNDASQNNGERSRQGPGPFLHGGVLGKLPYTVLPGRARRHQSLRRARKLSFCGRFFFTLPYRRIILSARVSFLCSRSRPSGYSNTEDAMKVSLTLLSLAPAVAQFPAMLASSHQAATQKKEAPAVNQ